MKQIILIAALICTVHLARAQTPTTREVPTPRPRPAAGPRPTPPPPPTPVPGVVETYKIVNGMNIRATVYNVDDGRRHCVVIVIHGGGYDSGEMETQVAQDLSLFRLMSVAIEYRMAPPHLEMNSPIHPFPGQNDI